MSRRRAFVNLRVPPVVAEMARALLAEAEPDAWTDDRLRRLQVLSIAQGDAERARWLWNTPYRNEFARWLVERGIVNEGVAP